MSNERTNIRTHALTSSRVWRIKIRRTPNMFSFYNKTFYVYECTTYLKNMFLAMMNNGN